jgi:hypothetical protein
LSNESKAYKPIKPDLKSQKNKLMEDLASAKIKALYFKTEGNKRAWDSWQKVVDCLESKLQQLKKS